MSNATTPSGGPSPPVPIVTKKNATEGAPPAEELPVKPYFPWEFVISLLTLCVPVAMELRKRWLKKMGHRHRK